jgi:hypothetical protein
MDIKDTLTKVAKDKLNKENLKPNSPKKKILLGVIVLLLGALGFEMSNKDFDLEKLAETGSFKESEVARDVNGDLLFDKEGNVVTDASLGKKKDEYNCVDFSTQSEAQKFFDKTGGVEKDINRLDGNKDGSACTSLPKNY